MPSGVEQADPAHFPKQLIDNVDEALRYAITVEEKRDMSTILNYEEEKAKLVAQLEDIRDRPNRFEGGRGEGACAIHLA